MRKFFFLFLLSLPVLLFGQTSAQNCASSQMLALVPDIAQLQEHWETNALPFFKAMESDKAASTGNRLATLTIPVVVHIIHNQGPENISDAQVIEVLKDLNDAFAKTGRFATSEGVATDIQFCLATQTPTGKTTTGINRIQSPLTNMTLGDNAALKNLSRWNPLLYLNIWIVSSINQNAFTGYASVPYTHGDNLDGIVVAATSVGKDNNALTHEVGHYLGLFHTFEGGCDNSDCLKNGDLVCDTPPDNAIAPVDGCKTTVNSCNTDPTSGFTKDENDLIWNFMDFGNNNCQTGFTKGQGNRMRYFLEVARGTLLKSKGCLPPCPAPITASFAASYLNADVGQTINFTNTSKGALQFQWQQNGATFSNQANISLKFDQIGYYVITLIASNGNPACEERFSQEISVTCPIEAKFNPSDPTPLPGDKVTFTNMSGAGIFQWFVDGTPIGNSGNVAHTFPAVGRYEVTLVAETAGSTCRDTATRIVDVVCVDADYIIGNPYPKPNEQVVFTNTSQGASNYVWSVNGTPVGNDKDMTYIFAQEGFYTVCVEAKTPACSDRFCTVVYALEAADETCHGTFLKTLKNGTSWTIQTMSPTPKDDGFFLAGQRDQKIYLAMVNLHGETQWVRTFDPSPQRDAASKLLLDGDQTIVLGGNGYTTADSTGFFLLKYDFVRDTVLWSQAYFQSAKISTLDILSQATNGSYQIFGHTSNPVSPQPNDHWRFTLELDPNTGQIVENRGHGYANEVFREAAYHQGATYVAGGNAPNPARLRAALSKYDASGNLLWARNYFVPATEKSALTFAKIFVDNDSLILFGIGKIPSISTTEDMLVVTKTDLEGNMAWAKQYRVFEAFSLTLGTVVVLPDGYLIRGNTAIGGLNTPPNFSDFFIRLDKQGNLVWANTIHKSFTEVGESAFLRDGFLYFNNSYRYFGKMDLNGRVGGSACKIITPLVVTVFDLPVRYYYHERFDLNPFQPDRVPARAIPSLMSTAIMQDQYTDGCVCSVPADPCLLAPDAAIVGASATCQGNNMVVNLTVYNNSTGELPQGTPIAFYIGDPTTEPAVRLGIQTTPNALKQGITQTFSFALSGAVDVPIFAVVNDNGSKPAPWSFDDFPNGHVSECFFQNNMRSFQLRYTPPKLDLGPDIAACDFKVATFRAAPGFADYTWQDGSKNPNFTAWQAGTYWVKAVDSCGGVHTDTVKVLSNGAAVDIGVQKVGICAGERATFSVFGFQRYRWAPATGLNCDTCAVVTITPSTNRWYYLTVTTATGCIGTDSVWVEVLPKVTTLETRGLCPGAQTVVFGQTVSQAGVYIARLKARNGCDSTHTIRVLALSPSFSKAEKALCPGDSVWVFNKWVKQPGIFEAHFTGANGCDSTHTLTVNAAPAIALDVQKQATQPGQASGSFKAVASGGTPPFTYQWSIPNAGNTPIVGNLAAGVYFLTVTDANGCSTTARLPLGTTALGDATSDAGLQLSPNPCQETLRVDFSWPEPVAVYLEIADPAGRTLLKTASIYTDRHAWSLDATAWPAGVYVCRANVGGRSFARVFVKVD